VETGTVKGYLLVRSEGKPYGLPVARVLEVGDAVEVLPVPRTLPAVRGLTPLRGRLVPLIHLGAFLAGRAAPESTATGPGPRTIVLVEIKGRHVAFEVDEADAVVREQPLPVPHGQSLPWASGVAERGAGEEGELVPILDLESLGDRIG
jgi:purine-binding chemotaxis protein CheW